MTLVSYTLPNDGEDIDASDVNGPFNETAQVINGNIDNDNIKTGANIDGSKLADNTVTGAKFSDNSVTTAKLADGSVTNAKLSTTAGEPGGAWKSWTPTITGLTVGNGTLVTKYKEVGTTIEVRIEYRHGTTSSIGVGAINITLPKTARIDTPGISSFGAGSIYFEDAGIVGYRGSFRVFPATVTLQAFQVDVGTFARQAAMTNTQPFVWGNGDFFAGTFSYERV